MITVNQLAEELGGVHPDSARRIAMAISEQLGITPSRKQISDKTPKRVLCWTREEADQILAEREIQGFSVTKPSAA